MSLARTLSVLSICVLIIAAHSGISTASAQSIGSACGTVASPLRIMPIGDSITESRRGLLSYRNTLWKTLKRAGCEVDLVGSRRGVCFGLRNSPSIELKGVAFDQDHEGHWGWRADQINDRLSEWLAANSPDVALIHLGTNDLVQRQGISSTIRDLIRMVDKIRLENPSALILVAKVVPSSIIKDIPTYNRRLERTMQKLSSPSSPIVMVDMTRGFSLRHHMQYDGLHPNGKGEALIGKRFAQALLQHLAEN